MEKKLRRDIYEWQFQFEFPWQLLSWKIVLFNPFEWHKIIYGKLKWGKRQLQTKCIYTRCVKSMNKFTSKVKLGQCTGVEKLNLNGQHLIQ